MSETLVSSEEILGESSHSNEINDEVLSVISNFKKKLALTPDIHPSTSSGMIQWDMIPVETARREAYCRLSKFEVQCTEQLCQVKINSYLHYKLSAT